MSFQNQVSPSRFYCIRLFHFPPFSNPHIYCFFLLITVSPKKPSSIYSCPFRNSITSHFIIIFLFEFYIHALTTSPYQFYHLDSKFPNLSWFFKRNSNLWISEIDSPFCHKCRTRTCLYCYNSYFKSSDPLLTILVSSPPSL